MMTTLNLCAVIVMYLLALAESRGNRSDKVAAAILFTYNLALAFVGEYL